jgi:hypothetical protein
MKTKKNRLFDELQESKISTQAMAITKAGRTTTSDQWTRPGPIDCQIAGALLADG